MVQDIDRRDFIRSAAISGGSALILSQKNALAGEKLPEHREKSVGPASAGERNIESSPRELTVAGFQLLASKDVKANEQAIHRAIVKAADIKADFLLTPEGSLSGVLC